MMMIKEQKYKLNIELIINKLLISECILQGINERSKKTTKSKNEEIKFGF